MENEQSGLLKARAKRRPWDDRIGIQLQDGDQIGVDVEMKAVPRGCTERGESTFFLEPYTAQILMDDLWAAGIRPEGVEGRPGELDATKRHLEDFRKLVFERGVKTSTPKPQ